VRGPIEHDRAKLPNQEEKDKKEGRKRKRGRGGERKRDLLAFVLRPTIGLDRRVSPSVGTPHIVRGGMKRKGGGGKKEKGGSPSPITSTCYPSPRTAPNYNGYKKYRKKKGKKKERKGGKRGVRLFLLPSNLFLRRF